MGKKYLSDLPTEWVSLALLLDHRLERPRPFQATIKHHIENFVPSQEAFIYLFPSHVPQLVGIKAYYNTIF